MAKLAERGHLFTYLEPELKAFAIASTTNQIEGGITQRYATCCADTAE